MDEAVVTVKLKQAHEYTNDLTEMRGLSKAEYVSVIVSYSSLPKTEIPTTDALTNQNAVFRSLLVEPEGVLR